jgi:hypothetical protein
MKIEITFTDVTHGELEELSRFLATTPAGEKAEGRVEFTAPETRALAEQRESAAPADSSPEPLPPQAAQDKTRPEEPPGAKKTRRGAAPTEENRGRSQAEPDVSTRKGGGDQEASTSRGASPPGETKAEDAMSFYMRASRPRDVVAELMRRGERDLDNIVATCVALRGRGVPCLKAVAEKDLPDRVGTAYEILLPQFAE